MLKQRNCYLCIASLGAYTGADLNLNFFRSFCLFKVGMVGREEAGLVFFFLSLLGLFVERTGGKKGSCMYPKPEINRFLQEYLSIN